MEKDEKPSFASIQENAEPRSQIVATLLQFRSLIAEKKDFSTRQTVHKTANPSTLTRVHFFFKYSCPSKAHLLSGVTTLDFFLKNDNFHLALEFIPDT